MHKSQSNRLFTVLLLSFVAAIYFLAKPINVHAAQKKPNFVFILSEDNSKHYLRLYGAELGATPAIESLAKNGLVFDHAFSNAPVCSVARTTLMTGILAPKAGFQYHRKHTPAQMPKGVKMWPAYLRDTGYYTTNNSKKDYNVIEGKGVWDESSRKATWRNRPSDDTPFFHMHTLGVSHEGSLHFPESAFKNDPPKTDPKAVSPAPYHPDTPTFRFTYARYFDRIKQMDTMVEGLVKQLEDDGLLENTFIFYFGDHGGVLPRGKGYLHESGLHVPLVARIPEKWRSKIPLEMGSRIDGFVSFIDFGPTLLHLAGLKTPNILDGSPFIGPNISKVALDHRDETFGYADRFDEKYEMCRSIRKGRYKYIRSFQPFYPDGLQNNYRYIMLAYEEWRTLHRQGKLNEAQSAFFNPKPTEQLFDLHSDPHEIKNLADDPGHAALLISLRDRLNQKLSSIHDLSFYPESYMTQHALNDGVAFGNAHADEIELLHETSNLALLPFDQAKSKLKEALSNNSPLLRYWSLTVCSSFGKKAESLAPLAEASIKDTDPLVRVRAAEFLALLGKKDPRPTFYQVLNENHGDMISLIALNSVVLFHDMKNGFPFDVTQLKDTEGKGEVKRRLDYLADRL
ncbi:MAG: sulfatase-like hydrolase/transferase [Verrucomicrobia bacterium]|jgi:arylsulfatase A-like enzyme|nr:sulfatase-like hydrolase/transferase [Verrucomicrobiota bacterium]